MAKVCLIRHHAGRANSSWKDLTTPKDAKKALEKFQKMADRISQGAIEFYENGELVHQMWPRRRK